MQTFDELWNDICTYKLDSHLKFHELKKGIKYANGCGAKGGTKFPDTMYLILIISACIIHDIEWKLAKSYQDLLDANERFDNNLKKITDKRSLNDIMRLLRRSRIQKYVSGVELVGTVNYAIERDFELPEDVIMPTKSWWKRLFN